MKTMNLKENRIQKLESRKLELESEISKLESDLSTLSGITSEVMNDYINVAAKNVAGVESNPNEVEKHKALVEKSAGNIALVNSIETELMIKKKAIKEINDLMYRVIPSEMYAEEVKQFIADAEKAIEKFGSSKQFSHDAIKEIIELDKAGAELNAKQSKLWKVYIPSIYGYLYASAQPRFNQPISMTFEDFTSNTGLRAKLDEECVRFFISAINFCKANYEKFIFNRFDDDTLCTHLVNSDLTDEQREHLSYWRADVFSK